MNDVLTILFFVLVMGVMLAGVTVLEVRRRRRRREALGKLFAAMPELGQLMEKYKSLPKADQDELAKMARSVIRGNGL